MSKEEVERRLKAVEEKVNGELIPLRSRVKDLEEEVKASQTGYDLEQNLRVEQGKELERMADEKHKLLETCEEFKKENEMLQKMIKGSAGLIEAIDSRVDMKLEGLVEKMPKPDLESKLVTKITDQVYELVKNREPALKPLDLSEVREFIRSEMQKQDVLVESTASDVKVELKREPAVFKEDSVEGQIALLILDKYFDKGRRVNHVTKELLRVWRKVDWHKVDEVLEKFTLPPLKLLVKEETEAGGAVYIRDTSKRAGTVGM